MQITWACRDGTQNHEFDLATDTCWKCKLTAEQVMGDNKIVQSAREIALKNMDIGLKREKKYYEDMDRSYGHLRSLLKEPYE